MLAPRGAPVLVAAGGTGGHLFPAEALAAALVQRGIAVHLATDRRAARYGGAFIDEAVHVIASATLRSRNPIALLRTATTLTAGFAQAWALIGRLKPARSGRLRWLSDGPAGPCGGLARCSDPGA